MTRADRRLEAIRRLLNRSHSCKVGTIPKSVIFRHNYKVEVGKNLLVRDAEFGSKFYRVLVTGINDDGYFFCELI